jgi:hypothetical protein
VLAFARLMNMIDTDVDHFFTIIAMVFASYFSKDRNGNGVHDEDKP